MNPLYLDDFEVGQTFQSGALTVSAQDIKAFARQFDPQPFHLDEATAKGTFFDGLAASGWHTAALTMRLLVEGPLKPAAGVIGAGGEISWPRPLRPGDELRVTSEIVEVRPSRSNPARGAIKVRSTTVNQNGDPVQILVANLIVSRRRSADAEGKR